MIVFSYGLEEYEPSRCNSTLARIAEMIYRNEQEEVLVVAQWETALAMGQAPRVIWPKSKSYLSSQDVIDEARLIFLAAGITHVIPVAQPFLQLPHIRRQLQKAGFSVVSRPIPRVGHNPASVQPWTRSGLSLALYALRSRLGMAGPFIPTRQSTSFASQYRSQKSVSPDR